MAELSLNTISGGYDLQKLNANFQAIQDAINDKLLWRVAEADKNIIAEDLDADGFTIYNLPAPVLPHNAVNKCYVDSLFGQANLATCQYSTFNPVFTDKSVNIDDSLSVINSSAYGKITVIGYEVFYKISCNLTVTGEGYFNCALTLPCFISGGVISDDGVIGSVSGFTENTNSTVSGIVVNNLNSLLIKFNIVEQDTYTLSIQGSFTLEGFECGGA